MANQMKRMIGLAAVAVVTAGMLAGCSNADGGVADAEPIESIDYATPEQVASVIAKYEPAWREVIAERPDCESTWSIAKNDESDLIADLESMNCMSSVHTMTVSAGTAVVLLDELTIPAELEDLVDDTKVHLTKLSESGVSDNCELSGDAAEPDCDMSMLIFRTASMQLESDLNAWSPYL